MSDDVWREITGPHTYEVHVRDLDGKWVQVISPDDATRAAANLREFADEIEVAAMEPVTCRRCGAYMDDLDLCPPCREQVDDRDARRWTA